MMPALVEKKLSVKAFKTYIDNPKARGPSAGKIYDLKNSPHISNR